jgi:hypothetical protein
MRARLCAAIIVGLLSQSAFAQDTMAGEWTLTIDDLFGPNIMRLTLVVDGEKLTGTAGPRAIEGRPSSSREPISVPADRGKGPS